MIASPRRATFAARILNLFRPATQPPSTIHDESSFRLLIAKERARADRRGIEFSLVELTPQSSKKLAGPQFESLLAEFTKRLRITDEVAVFQQRLNILLPDTPGDGACKVATDLCDLATARGFPLCPRVFVYPADQDRGQPNSTSTETVAMADREVPTEVDPAISGNPNPPSYSQVDVENMQFRAATPLWKRLLDVVAAGGGIIIFSPLMIGAALAIKLTSQGPVLFRQTREGKDGKHFVIYKFRTMDVGAEYMKEKLLYCNEQDGPAFKIKNDPRLTRVGAIIRKSCVDELPQLFNVLKGDMSMVGPRPLPIDESAACRPWQRRRLEVLPGMTCIWQVAGSRDISFEEWMRMDLRYIAKRSFRFDINLLMKTAQVALQHKGSV